MQNIIQQQIFTVIDHMDAVVMGLLLLIFHP